MEATPLALMSGLSARAHYANGIKIAKCPALLLTEMLRRFVQSDSPPVALGSLFWRLDVKKKGLYSSGLGLDVSFKFTLVLT